MSGEDAPQLWNLNGVWVSFTRGLKLKAAVDGKVIECQVAPISGVPVDNSQKYRPALQFADIPRGPFHLWTAGPTAS